MSRTHWKSLADSSQYLGKQHIDPDKDLVVTISEVEAKEVQNNRGGKETKRIMYFKEADIRPMILNVTNGRTIEKLLGTPYTEEWSGHQIAIWVDPSVPNPSGTGNGGLRVRDYIPKVETAYCAECGQEIKAHGSYSVNKIVTLSKDKYGEALCWDCSTKRKEAAE